MSLESELVDWIHTAALSGIARWDPTAASGILRYDRLPPEDRDAIAVTTSGWDRRKGIPGYFDVTFVILSQGNTRTQHLTVLDQIESRNKTESAFRPIDLTSYRIETFASLSALSKNGTTADGGFILRSSFVSRVKET